MNINPTTQEVAVLLEGNPDAALPLSDEDERDETGSYLPDNSWDEQAADDAARERYLEWVNGPF